MTGEVVAAESMFLAGDTDRQRAGSSREMVSWIWDGFLSDDYCGLKAGNSEEARARKESHRNFLKEGQHAGSPRLL